MLLKMYKLGSKHALAAPGANTNIFSTSLSPNCDRSTMRVTVALTTASVFNVTITDGTTAYTNSLNGGVALSAACLYTFTFACGAAYDYNFQVATDGVIRHLLVEEISGGVL